MNFSFNDNSGEENNSSSENSGGENNAPNNTGGQNNNQFNREDEGYTTDVCEDAWAKQSIEPSQPLDQIPVRHLTRCIRESDKMARSLRNPKTPEDIQDAEFFERRMEEMENLLVIAEANGEATTPVAMSWSDIRDSETNRGNSITNSDSNPNNNNDSD